MFLRLPKSPEANPDNKLKKPYLGSVRVLTGDIGIQTFNDKILKILNRFTLQIKQTSNGYVKLDFKISLPILCLLSQIQMMRFEGS